MADVKKQQLEINCDKIDFTAKMKGKGNFQLKGKLKSKGDPVNGYTFQIADQPHLPNPQDYGIQFQIITGDSGDELLIKNPGQQFEKINVWTYLPKCNTTGVGDPDTPRGTEVEVSGGDGDELK